jgi:alcohol dehydrogenase (cytochrome c)
VKALPLLLAAAAAAAPVDYERIRRAREEPGNWLTYSGTYDGQRHSPLDQITRRNVAGLKPAWVYQAGDLNKFETSPLVVDGILHISEPPGVVTALDGRTGRPLWTHRRTFPDDLRPCCGRVNRGLALLDGRVFMGTLDAHLVALDARSDRVLWDVEVADYKRGYSITVAPLALKDRVIVGVSGGEYGVRGLIDAYDAASGRRLWRFWTVPGPGEPGHQTWPGDSWKSGGASTWVTGSYDPEANLVYWGTGNPGPDYDGEVRRGDNLYSCSVVALDADTGRLVWHFQFTPHDVHDWDSNQVPVLIDTTLRGAPRKLMAFANRNGFYYLLDRLSGAFLAGAPFARQTWAKGLDERGRPIALPGKAPTADGNVVYPGMHGGTNFFSPSYSPRTGLFYVGVREEGTTFYRERVEFVPGRWYSGGGIRGIPGVEPTGSVKALEALTGKTRWEFPLRSPPWAGLLSTAGGLVFGGSSEGFFYALDAETGKPLWRFQTGGAIFASPVSFLVDGRQHVAIAAGNALFAFALE